MFTTDEKRALVNTAIDTVESYGLAVDPLRMVVFHDAPHPERVASYNPATDRIDVYLSQQGSAAIAATLEHELLHKHIIDELGGSLDANTQEALTWMEDSLSRRYAQMDREFGWASIAPGQYAAAETPDMFAHELQLTIMEDEVLDRYNTYACEHRELRETYENGEIPEEAYAAGRSDLSNALYAEVTALREEVPDPVVDTVIDPLTDRITAIDAVEDLVLEEAIGNVYSMIRPISEYAGQNYLHYLTHHSERSLAPDGGTTDHLEQLQDPGPLTIDNPVYVDFEVEIARHGVYGDAVADEMLRMVDQYHSFRDDHGAADAMRMLVETTIDRIRS